MTRALALLAGSLPEKATVGQYEYPHPITRMRVRVSGVLRRFWSLARPCVSNDLASIDAKDQLNDGMVCVLSVQIRRLHRWKLAQTGLCHDESGRPQLSKAYAAAYLVMHDVSDASAEYIRFNIILQM